LHATLEGLAVFEEEMVVIAPLHHAPITRGQDVNGESSLYLSLQLFVPPPLRALVRHRTARCRGGIFEMESYHGMLACVSAGAGLALMPRSMLESMPGFTTVSVWPLTDSFRVLHTWLIWRRGTVSQSLNSFVRLLEERVLATP